MHLYPLTLHVLKSPSLLFPQENFCGLSIWVMHGSLLNWLMCLVILTHFGDIVVAKITEGRESEMLSILQYPGNSLLQKKKLHCRNVCNASHCKECFNCRNFKKSYGGATERKDFSVTPYYGPSSALI